MKYKTWKEWDEEFHRRTDEMHEDIARHERIIQRTRQYYEEWLHKTHIPNQPDHTRKAEP